MRHILSYKLFSPKRVVESCAGICDKYPRLEMQYSVCGSIEDFTLKARIILVIFVIENIRHKVFTSSSASITF